MHLKEEQVKRDNIIEIKFRQVIIWYPSLIDYILLIVTFIFT